jgi:nucleotide-binding universal stress UspA family protein
MVRIFERRGQKQRGVQMEGNKKILVAVDDSAASDRAVGYVGQMTGGNKEFQILLFHVPAPMLPRLLEFGGAEDPRQEQRAETELRKAQAAWVEKIEKAAQPIFARAKSILRQAQVPEEAVNTQLLTPPAEEDLDTSILEAARANGCGTIVVGRESFSWMQELFQTHVAEKLLRQAQHLAVWIVL